MTSAGSCGPGSVSTTLSSEPVSFPEPANAPRPQLRREDQPPVPTSHGNDQGVSPRDGLADTVMRTIVLTGNDALNLLFQAAEQRDAESVHAAASTSHESQLAKEAATPSSVYHTIVADRNICPQPETEVLQVWDSFRFVKMGWFTAEEAVVYMNLFFKNLAASSPTCQGLDPGHAAHFGLITQEPLLCCTILMISSRYHTLPGHGGISRGTLIHQRLWEHCQHLIARIMFGQEKKSNAKTRTVGAIQALLLIVEWHPKAIHFPPAADVWDSDLLLSSSDRRDDPAGNRAATNSPKAQWLGDVVTPARMSDRMSWMLLGCAMSLAHELGICDMKTSTDTLSPPGPQQRSRNVRLRQLLFIFVEQLSDRLGCASIVTTSLSRSLTEQPRITDSSGSALLSGWIELTCLSRTINDALFPSPSEIHQLLSSFRYVSVIKHIHQQLIAWKDRYLKEDLLVSDAFQELSIEYHHLRISINSLGMQAAVDRSLTDQGAGVMGSQGAHTVLTATDYEFVQEVVSGGCQILQSSNKLAERGTLRFCPVRIFLRIIEASVFLLKALSLGSYVSNLQAALGVLEQCIRSLHASSLDDMHLASRYAALLDLHVARFRQCLITSVPPRGIPLLEARTGQGNGCDEASGQFSHSSTFEASSDDWLSLPFDPSIAAFGLMGETSDGGGFDDTSWDFLWNLQMT
ncbi:hypothetical protein LZ30DRAFT_582136 [Colletotrichum cereale]|nr:hypothetical protein LZ30DRAFT_582136 [Colletotrichum cereale]